MRYVQLMVRQSIESIILFCRHSDTRARCRAHQHIASCRAPPLEKNLARSGTSAPCASLWRRPKESRSSVLENARSLHWVECFSVLACRSTLSGSPRVKIGSSRPKPALHALHPDGFGLKPKSLVVVSAGPGTGPRASSEVLSFQQDRRATAWGRTFGQSTRSIEFVVPA